MRTQDTLPQDMETALLVAVMTFLVIFFAVSYLLWQVPFPYKLDNYASHAKHWAALRFHHFVPWLNNMAQTYRTYLVQVDSVMSSRWLTGRFDSALVTAGLCSMWLGYLAALGPSPVRHIVGRQLWRGKDAQHRVAKLSHKECLYGGNGISLHPDFQWHLARDRETRHFLIVGSVGGGKTQIIIPLVKAAIERGDRLVIFDNKGDFTSWLPKGVLFAPWDDRSAAWDIGRDCQNLQAARELAAKLIPEGSDPLWHTAARQILTAILIKLQREQNTSWGWRTLYDFVCLPREELLAIVQVNLPEARHVVDAPDRTAQSILVNFGAHMTLIADLAAAWGDAPADKRFSFLAWLDESKPRQRVLVLQWSGQYKALAKSYIQAIIATMSGHINSPSFHECRERRVWFILDEFPQLGELPEVAPLLEIGRSKGIRVVLGVQDMDQIKAIYGDHIAKSWASMIGTLIIVRTNAGETANLISKEVIGYRTVDRITVVDGKRQPPIRENILVIEPSELQSDLGPNATGVDALLMGFDDAYVLQWSLANVPPRRKSSVPAAWLSSIRSAAGSPRDPDADSDPAVPSPQLPIPSTDPSINSADRPLPPRTRLVLRQPAAELVEMADSGTSIGDAAEPVFTLSATSTGGPHESR